MAAPGVASPLGMGDTKRCSRACHRDAGWCSPKEGTLLMLVEILLSLGCGLGAGDPDAHPGAEALSEPPRLSSGSFGAAGLTPGTWRAWGPVPCPHTAVGQQMPHPRGWSLPAEAAPHGSPLALSGPGANRMLPSEL